MVEGLALVGQSEGPPADVRRQPLPENVSLLVQRGDGHRAPRKPLHGGVHVREGLQWMEGEGPRAGLAGRVERIERGRAREVKHRLPGPHAPTVGELLARLGDAIIRDAQNHHLAAGRGLDGAQERGLRQAVGGPGPGRLAARGGHDSVARAGEEHTQRGTDPARPDDGYVHGVARVTATGVWSMFRFPLGLRTKRV